MGEQYKAVLEEKIKELGGQNLRVFINDEGVHPKYREHLEATFIEAGVRFVASREEANFVFDGHSEPAFHFGQVVAFFTNEQIAFQGAF
jgi:hypothetical protein